MARRWPAHLCLRSNDTLYGRYWGCDASWTACTSRPATTRASSTVFARAWQRFDPGAQGEHKIQRGFTPIATVSAHWMADRAFAQAIDDFTRREEDHIDAYIREASNYLPFKQQPADGDKPEQEESGS